MRIQVEQIRGTGHVVLHDHAAVVAIDGDAHRSVRRVGDEERGLRVAAIGNLVRNQGEFIDRIVPRKSGCPTD